MVNWVDIVTKVGVAVITFLLTTSYNHYTALKKQKQLRYDKFHSKYTELLFANPFYRDGFCPFNETKNEEILNMIKSNAIHLDTKTQKIYFDLLFAYTKKAVVYGIGVDRDKIEVDGECDRLLAAFNKAVFEETKSLRKALGIKNSLIFMIYIKSKFLI